jgi:hypothetical protein
MGGGLLDSYSVTKGAIFKFMTGYDASDTRTLGKWTARDFDGNANSQGDQIAWIQTQGTTQEKRIVGNDDGNCKMLFWGSVRIHTPKMDRDLQSIVTSRALIIAAQRTFSPVFALQSPHLR